MILMKQMHKPYLQRWHQVLKKYSMQLLKQLEVTGNLLLWRVQVMALQTHTHGSKKFPRLRKWIGDKTVKRLKGHAYTIQNDDFEATVEIDRNDIEDDNLGIYKPQAEMAW